MQLQLIKFLLSKDVHQKYGESLRSVFKDNKEISQLLTMLDRLHSEYDKDITFAEYSTYVLANCMEKDREVFAQLLNTVSEADTESVILADVFADIMRRQKAYELALSALEVSEGRKNFADLVDMTKDLSSAGDVADDDVESMFLDDNLENIYAKRKTQLGLRWRLAALNRSLGSLRQGNFGFIFARPETGKTTFLASEVTYFAEQVRKRNLDCPDDPVGPIVWFNNEQEGGEVVIRVAQATFGITEGEIKANPQYYEQRFRDRLGKCIRYIDSASIHRKDVEKICRAVKPSAIIFDQIDKIKGFTDDREDLRLGHIYVWARELAKEYCPVIGVCQADGTAEGKKWLTMDNVANAKTSKQAEADWILGIGKVHTVDEEFMRYLHLSKNKLPGDADTDPRLRHGRMDVRINPEIGRYEDI